MAKKWTKEEVELLKAYSANPELTKADIAKKMKRTVDSIDKAGTRYGIKKVLKNTLISRKVSKEEKKIENTINVIEGLDDEYFSELKEKAKTAWDVPKTKIKNGKDKGFKSYLVVSDIHVPDHSIKALRPIFKMMDDVKFDGLVNLGDFCDNACISHWNKSKQLTSEGKKLKSDYIIGNALLDEFDKRLPKNCDKHFMIGNHEEFYYQFLEYNPMLEGFLNPINELHLKERGYKVYEKYNDIFRIGKLNFTHGIYCGLHYVKKHIDECKTNIIFGHVHSQRERYECSPAKQLSIAGYAVGCLCDKSPDYMRNKPNKWTNGFACVNFYPNGEFNVQLVRIVNGKFIFNGKIYS